MSVPGKDCHVVKPPITGSVPEAIVVANPIAVDAATKAGRASTAAMMLKALLRSDFCAAPMVCAENKRKTTQSAPAI